ncbi:MAG: PrpF family protein [Burkholderiaceae bacterium]|jgi:2-methylaconitate isomerase|nr:PrpF family protein [Burkholderiaceae bacterium]
MNDSLPRSSFRMPAVFMRGGTSKALMFRRADLPAARGQWDALLLAAMGSPDPNGRQLNGMGGGLSSVSKVCVVGPPSRPDADVDYIFAQVLIDAARVDYAGNCGNMSSAVGPFAYDEGLARPAPDAAGQVTLRIHNTNTGKLIASTFVVRDGRSVEHGDLAIPGVAGTGSPIRLDFLEPGGAITGRLLPTGRGVDVFDVPDAGRIEASCVDAANACVFVRAADLGLTGIESPQAIEADRALMDRLLALRAQASVAMGIAPDLDAARAKVTTPSIGIVAPPAAWTTLAGEALPADACDLTVRMISSNQPHRALPLTASVCIAVAAQIEGTLVHAAVRRGADADALRLGMPSGVLTVAAEVERRGSEWHAVRGAFYRTARRLFEGFVFC